MNAFKSFQVLKNTEMVKFNFFVCFQFTHYIYTVYAIIYSRGICRSECSNLNKGTAGSIFSIQVFIDVLGYRLSASQDLNLLFALFLLIFFF